MSVTQRNKLKRGCCCSVASSKYTAFESWCGISSRYWYTAVECVTTKIILFGGFHGPGRLQPRGKRSRGYLPEFATLNARSTRHGAQPEPILAPWCTGGPSSCPAAESARKDPRPEENSFVFRKSQNFMHKHIICTRYLSFIIFPWLPTLYAIVIFSIQYPLVYYHINRIMS